MLEPETMFFFYHEALNPRFCQSWTLTAPACTTSSSSAPPPLPPPPPRRRESAHFASTTSCRTKRPPCVATRPRLYRALSARGTAWKMGAADRRRPPDSQRRPRRPAAVAAGTDDASRWVIRRSTPSSTWRPILRPWKLSQVRVYVRRLKALFEVLKIVKNIKQGVGQDSDCWVIVPDRGDRLSISLRTCSFCVKMAFPFPLSIGEIIGDF